MNTSTINLPAVPVTAVPSLTVRTDLIPFVAFLLSRTGQFMRVSWRRSLKTRKGVESTVEKIVTGVFRAGIAYDNRAIVQEKRETGELPAENAGLPWGQWVKFPYLIEHKGTFYVRLYPTDVQVHSQLFLNGMSARREEVEPLCLASEFRDGKKPDCFTVKLESICAASVTNESGTE